MAHHLEDIFKGVSLSLHVTGPSFAPAKYSGKIYDKAGMNVGYTNCNNSLELNT